MSGVQRQQWIAITVKWVSISAVSLTFVITAVYEFAYLKAQVINNTNELSKLPPEWLKNEIAEIKRSIKDLEKKVNEDKKR